MLLNCFPLTSCLNSVKSAGNLTAPCPSGVSGLSSWRITPVSGVLWNLLNPLRNKWDILYMYRFLSISFPFFISFFPIDITSTCKVSEAGMGFLCYHTCWQCCSALTSTPRFLSSSFYLTSERLHCSFAQILTIP